MFVVVNDMFKASIILYLSMDMIVDVWRLAHYQTIHINIGILLYQGQFTITTYRYADDIGEGNKATKVCEVRMSSYPL